MDTLIDTCRHALKDAKTILLVDWANENILRSLIAAGFTVFSYSPGRYSRALIEDEKLVFKALAEKPEKVDIVYIYRPEAEHAGIIDMHVLPLQAKVLWLYPPVTSAKTAELAAENGIVFIEGVDITTVDFK
jgi:predicted CoA-binding protein